MPYIFSLDSFSITNTRSAHKDTDYVAFTAMITGQAPVTQTRSIGSVNNGSHAVGLAFSGIALNPGQNLVLNYFIVNAGKADRVTVELALERVGRAFASGGPGIPQAPNNVSAMGSQPVVDWFNEQLQALYALGSCDGLVAVEQDVLTYFELLPGTTNTPYVHTSNHSGTEPPSGCNKHVSGYSVTWRCVVQATVPDVSGLLLGDKGAIKGADTLISAAGLVPKHASGPNADPVISTVPLAGAVVAAQTVVSITTGNA